MRAVGEAYSLLSTMDSILFSLTKVNDGWLLDLYESVEFRKNNISRFVTHSKLLSTVEEIHEAISEYTEGIGKEKK